MALSHLLEDFSAAKPGGEALQAISEDDLEDHKLQAFERGYSAGWEDAIAARERDQTQIGEALARGLDDISFSYHEALAQMTGALEPLFQSLVDAVLPEAMALSFGHHIVAQLQEMAAEEMAGPVILHVPPGAAPALRPILERGFAVPVDVNEDPDLPAGRACLRLGKAERRLDCRTLIDRIGTAVDGFVFEANKEMQHG